ncbi:Eco29kI family restriction endonuclease [Corynebacterium sanguinis]|uniref:Eco29kI family restriction endonuclease n=2 Tax=Corynebacterium sanguinis TaxID=2594913 RepID=UPI00119DDECD|nr:Eco29kI family restriction endonuclease [Corynebacterium sanguinis]MDN8577941.1 Eco29kI family restriction endonuclease [Corynebacterium sanguinis]TVS24727.1 Eco29kI family restriction endonuclease [Corynebacterium sanguinis]
MPAFDPLDYENLGASISRALDEQPVQRLDELETFDGAGVYALYYVGDFPAYAQLSEVNRELPGNWAIYIGKAEAENARKGEPNQAFLQVGPKLYNRIKTHRKSIEQSSNLDVGDFLFRALPVAPTWVPLAEVISIRMHQPVWNKIVDGLGNHDPGKGRRDGMRPRWDTLHPGRPWAEKLAERKESTETIMSEIETFLRGSVQYQRFLES